MYIHLYLKKTINLPVAALGSKKRESRLMHRCPLLSSPNHDVINIAPWKLYWKQTHRKHFTHLVSRLQISLHKHTFRMTNINYTANKTIHMDNIMNDQW